MSAQHTTGPWKLGDHGKSTRYIDAYGWSRLAKVYIRVAGGCSPEGEANARLISTAPDLLAALRELLAVAPAKAPAASAIAGIEARHAAAIKAARVAIAKATGETP